MCIYLGVSDLKLETSPTNATLATVASSTASTVDTATTAATLVGGGNCSNRFSTASSTDEDPHGVQVSDQLVVAQIHREPIPESTMSQETSEENLKGVEKEKEQCKLIC